MGFLLMGRWMEIKKQTGIPLIAESLFIFLIIYLSKICLLLFDSQINVKSLLFAIMQRY